MTYCIITMLSVASRGKNVMFSGTVLLQLEEVNSC